MVHNAIVLLLPARYTHFQSYSVDTKQRAGLWRESPAAWFEQELGRLCVFLPHLAVGGCKAEHFETAGLKESTVISNQVETQALSTRGQPDVST